MKRLLCAAVLGTAALTAVPADAASNWPVRPIVWNDSHRIGVGTEYSFTGSNYQPLGGAWVNRDTGEVCVGFSYQIPQCAGGPIE